MKKPKLTPKQSQLFAAIEAGAKLSYRGWQEIGVDYGPRDERNYVARETTLFALRDRGLVLVDKYGVRLADTAGPVERDLDREAHLLRATRNGLPR